MKPGLFLLRAEQWLARSLRVACIACLLVLVMLLLLNIVGRLSGLFGMNWFDEVVVTVFAWLVFIGACALWRERDHFAISLLTDALQGHPLARPQQLAVALLGLLFAAVLLVYGALFVSRSTATTPVLGLPQAWAYACVPLAGLLMTGYALRDVWQALTAPLNPAVAERPDAGPP